MELDWKDWKETLEKIASRAKGNEDKSSKLVKDEVMKDLLETCWREGKT